MVKKDWPLVLNSVIGLSDLIDLWVIKIKKPMILCARSTSRSREQSTKRRSRSESMLTVCLFYNQNNKIVWLSNMADTFLEKFTSCAKVCGLFLLSVFFGCWLAEQTNSNHMVLFAVVFSYAVVLRYLLFVSPVRGCCQPRIVWVTSYPVHLGTDSTMHSPWTQVDPHQRSSSQSPKIL